MKNYTQTQKVTIAGIAIALYIVIMMCTQTFAFGQYQVRIATAMYGLSAIFPFLIVPFGVCAVWRCQCHQQYTYGRAWAFGYDWRRHRRHFNNVRYRACQTLWLR